MPRIHILSLGLTPPQHWARTAAAVISFALALLLGVIISSTLVRRLVRLRSSALTLAAGGVDAPPPPDDSSGDEVGDLDFPRWPYAADRVVALGLTRLPKPTLQTLANYRLIWVRGYAFQDQLHSVGRYQEVQRREGIPAMLREGRADFYIDDDAEVDFLLASLERPTDLQVTELQLLPLYLAFARTERGRALKQLYEQRMDVLVRSGSLRAIFNRWKDHYPYDSAQEPYHGTP